MCTLCLIICVHLICTYYARDVYTNQILIRCSFIIIFTHKLILFKISNNKITFHFFLFTCKLRQKFNPVRHFSSFSYLILLFHFQWKFSTLYVLFLARFFRKRSKNVDLGFHNQFYCRFRCHGNAHRLAFGTVELTLVVKCVCKSCKYAFKF